MIKWKDEYSIGIDRIDDEHKKLVEIANRAYEILNNNFYIDKYDKIVEILKELEDYTVFHFNDEENYMRQIGYKKFFSHKIEHEEFIQKIKSVDLNKIDYNQDKYLLEIINFIVDWLVKHILEKDKLIVSDK
ncbi:bacteriohemerythrin [Clostridium sp. SYSU_GA19001]|uniref:bacteriohemerythrin n=1 Tax=Clostridium caldaquaticum TaxID=2940653 RepID=UPI0020770EEA|nr:bacteriohemerythrin [Clostridium caldaquaticum]MCM8709925.1 bacteriohemerythrin [Clostridium caldaquaticum]